MENLIQRDSKLIKRNFEFLGHQSQKIPNSFQFILEFFADLRVHGISIDTISSYFLKTLNSFVLLVFDMKQLKQLFDVFLENCVKVLNQFELFLNEFIMKGQVLPYYFLLGVNLTWNLLSFEFLYFDLFFNWLNLKTLYNSLTNNTHFFDTLFVD